MEAGEYAYTVSKEGYKTETKGFTVGDEDLTLTIELELSEDHALVEDEENLTDALEDENINRITLEENLTLTETPKINKALTLHGSNKSINTGLNIDTNEEVDIEDMTFKPVNDDYFSDLGSNKENIIIGVRKGKLTADNINIEFTREVAKEKINLVGISVQGAAELDLLGSSFKLSEEKDTSIAEDNHSLVYGVYAQENSTAVVNNNTFNLNGVRRTAATGVELSDEVNEEINISGNTLNEGEDNYNLQVLASSEIDETELHNWVDSLLDENQKAYINNGGGSYYEHPESN